MESSEQVIKEEFPLESSGMYERKDDEMASAIKAPDIDVKYMDGEVTPSEGNYKEQFSSTKILIESGNSDNVTGSC